MREDSPRSWSPARCVEVFLRIGISRRQYSTGSISKWMREYLVSGQQEGRGEVAAVRVEGRDD